MQKLIVEAAYAGSHEHLEELWSSGHAASQIHSALIGAACPASLRPVFLFVDVWDLTKTNHRRTLPFSHEQTQNRARELIGEHTYTYTSNAINNAKLFSDIVLARIFTLSFVFSRFRTGPFIEFMRLYEHL